MTKASRQSSVLHWCTPAFLACLLVLASIELTTRYTMAEFFSGRYQYGFDADSGFVESDDAQVRFVRAGGRRFYPQTLTQPKPAGTFRIITVGDSIARGASLAEAYPNLLAERLRERGYRVEAVNLALPGFGARRQQLILARALKYSPDLIIFHFGMSNEFEDERDWARAQSNAQNHPRDWFKHSYLLARLQEYKADQITPKFLPEKIRLMSALTDAEEEASANRDPARVQAWQIAFAKTFEQSMKLVRTAQVPALLIPRIEVQGQMPSTSIYDSGLKPLLSGHLGPSVRWFEMSQAFGEGPDTTLFARDRVHMHPPAHVQLAQTLSEQLTLWAGEPNSAIAALHRAQLR